MPKLLQSREINEIQKAIKQADLGGTFIEHEKVDQWLKSWGRKIKIIEPQKTTSPGEILKEEYSIPLGLVQKFKLFS